MRIGTEIVAEVGDSPGILILLVVMDGLEHHLERRCEEVPLDGRQFPGEVLENSIELFPAGHHSRLLLASVVLDCLSQGSVVHYDLEHIRVVDTFDADFEI